MYQKNEFFTSPDKESVRIWKYMSFEKFLLLLEKKALYFSSPEQFDDQVEGYHTIADLEEI
jgi:hypothetical protein